MADGSLKTTFKPKAGFDWPAIKLPSLQLPDWDFGSGDASVKVEKKSRSLDRHMQMPKFSVKGKVKTPKLDSIADLLAGIISSAKLPEVQFRDNSVIQITDLPDAAGRSVNINTEVPEADLPSLPSNAEVTTVDLPDGKKKHTWVQRFDGDVGFELPEVNGAEIDVENLPDGSIRKTYRPKLGFKWPEISLPKFHLPDWHFKAKASSPRKQKRKDKKRSMTLPGYGISLRSKGRIDGVGDLLSALIVKPQLPAVQFRENSEVDVLELPPDHKKRQVKIRTEIPAGEVGRLPKGAVVDDVTLPDGKIKHVWIQNFDAIKEIDLPDFEDVSVTDITLPDTTWQRTYKPLKAKWPSLHMPDISFKARSKSETSLDRMRRPKRTIGERIKDFFGIRGRSHTPRGRIDLSAPDLTADVDISRRSRASSTESIEGRSESISKGGTLKRLRGIFHVDGKKKVKTPSLDISMEGPEADLSLRSRERSRSSSESTERSARVKGKVKTPKMKKGGLSFKNLFGKKDGEIDIEGPSLDISLDSEKKKKKKRTPSFKGIFGKREGKMNIKWPSGEPKGIWRLLSTFVPSMELPNLHLSDMSKVKLVDSPDKKKRKLIIDTDLDANFSGDTSIFDDYDEAVLPDGNVKRHGRQTFDVDASLDVPDIDGIDMKLVTEADGSVLRTFSPESGFKWPDFSLPSFEFPDIKMPKFGAKGKGKAPKSYSLPELLAGILPVASLPSLQFRDNSTLDVIDLPDGKRKLVINTEIPETELKDLPEGADIQVETSPDGPPRRIWRQTFDVDADFELPEVEGAITEEVSLPDGTIKKTIRPKDGFTWPDIHLPKFHLPDWQFKFGRDRSPSPTKKEKADQSFSMKMPSFGFGGKSPKVPKFNGIDGMLEYLLPAADLPKLRIRDNTEVDVIDLPEMKSRDIVVKTQIPDVDLPKLSGDLKVDKFTLPDGSVKNMLNQKFKADAGISLPKLSGADICDTKLPDGSVKTSFKPKPGFRWPTITLPALQMPDWEFGTGEKSPSPKRKTDKGDGDFSFGVKMPTFGFGGKGPKIPKFSGLDVMLEYLLPKADLPKLRIRDNTEVDVIDLPDLKGRDVIVKTEIPDVELPKLSGDLKVDKITLPDGGVKNILSQKFKANAELHLPKLSGADIDDIKLPDGSIKTSFKPKAGFKWPKISLPEFDFPDWQFGSGDRSPSPDRKRVKDDSDFSFGMKMPSFGIGGKGPTIPKFDGLDGMLEYLIPSADLPKLRMRDNTEVDVIDLPDMKGRDVIVKTEIPDVNLPKLSGDLKVDKVTLPDGRVKNILNQKFKGNAEMTLPKLWGADIDDLKLPDGSVKTSFKPKAGFKWPTISLPSFEMPDWQFRSGDRSPSPERKRDKDDSDFSIGMKMPSLGFVGKGPKIPKFDGLDGMLEYLLPKADLPKLRIRDNTEVDVIDLPEMKGRDVIVKTEIRDIELPKLSGDLEVDKITLPDGGVKNMLNQTFKANAELPLPKLSGANIDDIKLPDGSIKTSFKPKAGFKWPKISLPDFQMPDWQFGSGDRSPSPERKDKDDSYFGLGMKMPSFGFGGKGPKIPKFDSLDGMLEYLLPQADLPKLRIRDNTEVDVIDLPEMKGRDIIVKTDIPDVDLPKLSGDLKVDTFTLPDGRVKNMLNQKFKGNVELPLPKLSGADIDDIKLPDGSIKTSFKPKAGFKWPQITLPSLQMPDWEFGSGDRSSSPERSRAKDDSDFSFGMKMPSFGFGGEAVPKFDGLDDMLEYLLPKADLPKLRIRDNTEVDVIDLPDLKGRDVIIKTEIPDVDLPKLSGDLKVNKITLPDGGVKNMLNQKFKGNPELPLPKLSGANIDDIKLPDGSIKTSFKPKAGFKWPKISLPDFQLPDWQFGSGDRSPSPERKHKDGSDFSLGMKMPSFGFGGKGPKIPKFDGLDGMLEYLLPQADLPKLRIRDNTEVDVIDLPDMKGRDVIVKTDIPDVDLPKLSGDLKVDTFTLPDGQVKNMLNQKFKGDVELPLPKLSGADIDEIKLPDGSVMTSFKPKAGFKWPKIALPSLQLPDWEFGSNDRASSPERTRAKDDGDFSFGMKMPSFGFGGKGPKIPKFDGLDGMLEYLLPKAELPKLRIRDDTEVDVIDLPDMKGRDVIVKTEIPDVDLPKLSGDLNVEKITLPDGKIKNVLHQKFKGNAELPLPKLSGASIDDAKLPNGSIKTSFKPKAGFKWPKINLPELQMPDWDFRSGERSPSPEKKAGKGDSDFHFGVKMPSFGFGVKSSKMPKFDGLDGMLGYLLPKADLPKLRIRDNSEVDIIDLPELKGRSIIVKTDIPDADLPKLSGDMKVDKITLPHGITKNVLCQKFEANAELPLPKLSGADIEHIRLPDGSIKTNFKPKAGFKWPKIRLPELQLPDWEFGSSDKSPLPEKKQKGDGKKQKSDSDFRFGMKMPSFGFGAKSPKIPKFDGLDGMLEYILLKDDLPKIRFRDNTEVDVIDLPDMKGRDVIIKTEVPDVDLPKLSPDLKVEKITLPNGKVKNIINQTFTGDAKLPLPKLSGADIDDIKLPNGSMKTSFKPKAGFKWPKIKVPSLQMPDWEFASSERSPSPERKREKGDSDFHFGVQMPSFSFGSKGTKIPKFDGLDSMLEYLLHKADLPKIRIRDNTEIDVIDLPEMKGRDVIVKTEVPDVEVPKLSGDLKIDKITLPDGGVMNMLNQKFKGNPKIPLPKLSGANIEDIKLPDGSIKTSFKPKAGFKWPKISLPDFQLPDWQFGSGDRSPSPERKHKDDSDFSLGMKMPSFGFGGKGPKIPKFDGLDGMLEYLLPQADLPKLRIRDNTEVDVIDLPDMKGRDVIVKTDIPDVDLPKLSGDLKVDTFTLPDGQVKNMLNQKFKGEVELPLPKLSGADIDEIKLPDGSVMTSFKPKAGFKWPKITLPSLQMPDWEFGSGDRSSSLERTRAKDDSDFSFGMKMPSFGFGGEAVPKFDGLDDMLEYLLPKADLPKLRIRDNTEVDVIDLPDMKGRDIIVKTEIPDVDLPKLSGDLKVDKITLPDGGVKNMLNQKFKGNPELPLPKLSGANIDDIKLPDGSIVRSFKPKAGFKWPKISLPGFHMPDWEFSSGEKSPSTERKSHSFGMKMPSMTWKGKGPKLSGIGDLLAHLVPKAQLPLIQFRDNSVVHVLDLPDGQRRLLISTDVPEADLSILPNGADVQVDVLPDGSKRRVWRQSFDVDPDFELPSVDGADMEEVKLSDGSIQKSYKPKGGFKWPEIHLPKFHLPDWEFRAKDLPEKDDHEASFGLKMPSFGFGKGYKVPKVEGIDGLLVYLLPETDLPKLRIRDNTKVHVIDMPNMKGRDVVVKTEIPDVDIPKLSGDLKVDKITLPEGGCKHILNQRFKANAELPLPKLSGADIGEIKLSDGSIKTTFEPKAGFKWPKISLPTLQMPDWEFGSGHRSPSPEKKHGDHHFSMKMPSFGFGGKGVKVPKFDGLDGMLGYLLPETDLPKLRIRDNTEVDVVDWPDMQSREVVVKTEISDVDFPKLSEDLKVDKVALPDGSIKNMLNQKFNANVEVPLPKLSGADINEIELPDGSIKTSFKPKAGFKWPKITLPSLQMPDWEFGSRDRSVSPERRHSDHHFSVKMPSFGFGMGVKVPKLNGLDSLLAYLLPEKDIPKLRLTDSSEVDVIDLPGMKGREVVVRTEVSEVNVASLPASLKIEPLTMPDDKLKQMLNQKFKADVSLPLPKVSGAEIEDVQLPDGSIKTSFKPKAGFKWPEISIPTLEMPDWEFSSGLKSSDAAKGDGDFHFGMKMPSFGFGKGVKVPKVDGLDGLLHYLLPKADLPKLRIRDDTEVDVIDLPAMKGREVVLTTYVPEVEVPKLSSDLKVKKVTLPDGACKYILTQMFQGEAELPLPKVSGADIGHQKLPDGSLKTNYRPKAGFKWPKIKLPHLHMPDWEFGAGRSRSPSPEKESREMSFGMPSISMKGKFPYFDGIGDLLDFSIPKAELPSLNFRENSTVDFIDLPSGKRQLVIETEVPEAELPDLPADAKIELIDLPDGGKRRVWRQYFYVDADIELPKIEGAEKIQTKLPDGSVKWSYKPMGGFKWPEIHMPKVQVPDWKLRTASGRSMSPLTGKKDASFHMKMPSFGFGKGVKVPKLDGIDGLLGYLLPEDDLPKVRIRDNSELDVIDLPGAKSRDVVIRTEIPDVDLPKLTANADVRKVTLPSGMVSNILDQKFSADAKLPLPKVSGAEIDEIKLSDGSLKTTFKPKAGFSWPEITLPSLQLADWKFSSGEKPKSATLERKGSKNEHDSNFGFRMPSFGFKKGAKAPKFDGIDELLGYLLPEKDVPKLRIRDDTEVDVIDFPKLKKREVTVRTEIPAAHLPKLPSDLKCDSITLPDGGIKNVLNQQFDGNFELPLPKMSGVDVDDAKQSDGSRKTTFKPKAGFKWPNIKLPILDLPDWKFSSGEDSPSTQRKTGNDDHEIHIGLKMPSFGMKKTAKTPKFDSIDGLLGYLLPAADISKLKLSSNSEVDVIDLPEMKGREVVVRTDISEIDLPKLPSGLQVERLSLPDGSVRNELTQKFIGNAELHLPKVSGADITDMKMPDGSLKTKFRPKAGFKWPQFTLPSLEMPDWEFRSGDKPKSASLERSDSKGDRDFGLKMPSFGFKKGVKIPKFDGVDGLLGYLLPEADIPKLRIRDNTEVDVIDLPEMKGRDVVVKTEIHDVDLPKLSGGLKIDKITLPDGGITNMLNQRFKANAELPLPKLPGADIDDYRLPDGSIKTSFRPKAGFKWPKITLPNLQMPDWEFDSGDRSKRTSLERGMKLPSFGFKKGVKALKFDGLDGMLGYLLPEVEIPKLRIRDNSEVDVIDLSDGTRDIHVRTEISDVDIPKLSGDQKIEKITLPDGSVKSILNQIFKGNAELPLPKVHGADIAEVKLPNGSLKTTYKPKAGFKWPKFSLPNLDMPDWEFSSSEKSSSLERKEPKGDHDFHMGIKMPSFGFKKGVKAPKFDGVDGLLGYLLPESDLPSLRIRDTTEVDILDMPSVKGRDIVVRTGIPDADLPKLPSDLKVVKIPLPDGTVRNELTQKYKGNFDLALPKVSGADFKEVKLPDGSVSTTFKPKAGFKWPTITLPSLQMPEWEFRSGEKSPTAERKEKDGDSDFSFGVKMPSFGMKKGVKVPKCDGIDDLLGYLLPETELSKLRIRDNTEVDVIDIPDGKDRKVSVRTEIPEMDLPKLSADLRVEKLALPDGSVKNMLTQTFNGNAELALPKVSGADIDDIQLPDGTLKTTFKPKAGFKWPKIRLPSLQMPGWDFGSGDRSPSPERKGGSDFNLGLKMPSFGIGKGVKVPKVRGIDGLLTYVLPEGDIRKVRIRDNSEVDIIDMPDLNTRNVIVRTEIPEADVTKLSGKFEIPTVSTPDGQVRHVLTQQFSGKTELPLPKVGGADIDSRRMPDSCLKTTYKPKAGFAWPKIKLPSLNFPDWDFSSGGDKPDAESDDDGDDFELSLPSFGFGKGVKPPKLHGVDALLAYLIPEKDIPSLRIREDTEVDIIDLPDAQVRDVHVRTTIPDVDIQKLPSNLTVENNVLTQKFKGNFDLLLPKVTEADIDNIGLPNGALKTTYKPSTGRKWPEISLPTLEMPGWRFRSSDRSPSPERKASKESEHHFGIRMPSFGFKKGVKTPKFDSIDGLLGYLLPNADLPKLRIKDDTEVDIIDDADPKTRSVVVRTIIPDADLPKLPAWLKVNKLTFPDGSIKNVLEQSFVGNADLHLPKVAGAEINETKLQQGSFKTTYRPKAGFKWPKFSLPELEMPDWQFSSDATAPHVAVERKESKGDHDFHLGMKMPSFGFKKGAKTPKFDGIDGLLGYLLPESDIPSLRIRDNTEVDVVDLPNAKGREVVVRTDIPDADLPNLSEDLNINKITLPNNHVKNELTQKYTGNAELILPKVSGAVTDDVKLSGGILKTTYKPRPGFKWPKLSLPGLHMPDWEFRTEETKEKSSSLERGLQLPSFSFKKNVKVPKLDGVDGLLGYLLPESDLPKLRIRDNTEVDVIELPDMRGREVIVSTDIPDADLPKLSIDLKTEKITLPDGRTRNLLSQKFKANAELPLPKVSGADIDNVKLPNGSTRTSFKPKAGFKWPKISLPSLQLPDWEFGSGQRSPSPERKEKGDSDFSFGVKMPSFGFGKGVKIPKLDGVDGLLGYLLPESDLPKLRIRDNTEVDVIDLPDMKGREVVVRTDIPDADLPKLSADLKTEKITLPDGKIQNLLSQKFKANAELPLPKVSGADIDDVKLPNGSIKTSFKPKAGFKWPKISLPSLQLPDWEFGSGQRSPSPERKEKGDSDFSFGVKMPSFGFGKGVKIPKLDGVDGLLGYLLPESDLPKLRIRDNTEVDVIDLPDMKGREVVVRTDIPDVDLPKLSADLKTEKITLPDGKIQNLLSQKFKANAELPLPKVSGADIDDVKLPNGSIKTSFKPKAGFKWPKISLPSLQLPDWEFGSGQRSPSPERKGKGDSDFSFGVKMPSFGFGKGVKVPKLDGVDGLLAYLLPESDLPKLRIRDNTEVDVIDLPDMKGREVVVRTDIPDVDLPRLSADLKTEKITLPDGKIQNLLSQKFKANAELPLPKVSGADIDDVKLPNGSIKTSFKPKAGFKWPKISLPSLQLPDWEFGSGQRSPSPERKEKGDSDFSFGVKMPSFGFGKGVKIPKLDGVDGLLGYLLPESDLPKLRIRDNTEVDVIDLPDMKGREVVVRTDIPDVDLPKLSADLKTEKITLPDGKIQNLLSQKFKANAELPLPKVSGADIDDVKLPNGSIKTSFKPKAGFKWPKISLPSLQLPDWEFGSGQRSPSPERKEKGDSDFSFGVKMPSFGFGKGVKIPKLDGVDGLLGHLLPESDLPKLRIRDNTEVDVIDLPDMKGREVVVRTDIPDVDLPKLSADLKTEKITLPDGKIQNLLSQKFKANAELPLPKVSGADIDDVKLPNGSIKTSFKPKAGFKWPKISLPSLQLPDWEFGSGQRSPSPEIKEKGDSDFSFGVKMPSFGFGKGVKVPKLDGVDGLLAYLLPESDLPKLRIRDNTEVDVIDLPDMKGREVVVRTDIPDVDLPKLSADLKTEKITLPDGKIQNLLSQKFKANAELPLPKVSGADIDDVKLPNGSIKTSFKPKAGFKWPKISLPSLQLPDWEFGSGQRSPSPERKEKGDSDFSFGVKMPSFGFGKGVKGTKARRSRRSSWISSPRI